MLIQMDHDTRERLWWVYMGIALKVFWGAKTQKFNENLTRKPVVQILKLCLLGDTVPLYLAVSWFHVIRRCLATLRVEDAKDFTVNCPDVRSVATNSDTCVVIRCECGWICLPSSFGTLHFVFVLLRFGMVSKFRQPGSDLLTFVFVAFALLPFLLDPEVIPNPTSLESGSSVALMCERCSLFATAEAGRGFPEVIDVLIAAGANPDRSF